MFVKKARNKNSVRPVSDLSLSQVRKKCEGKGKFKSVLV